MNRTVKKWKVKTKKFMKQYGKGLFKTFAFLIVFALLFFVLHGPFNKTLKAFLRIENIKVIGVQYYSSSDILSFLKKYRGYLNWEINKNNLKNEIKKKFKWVKSVTVSNFPSRTLVVYIEEQEPVVFYKDPRGRLWVVGENGEILARYSYRTLGYVYLPILTCDRELIPFVVKRLQNFKQTSRGRDFVNVISEIIVPSKDSKWVLILNNFKAKVLVDPFGQFKNVDFFIRMKDRILDQGGDIEYVDLSFKNQLIVKKAI